MMYSFHQTIFILTLNVKINPPPPFLQNGKNYKFENQSKRKTFVLHFHIFLCDLTLKMSIIYKIQYNYTQKNIFLKFYLASFNTSATILPIPSNISCNAVSHMYAGVVTILLFLSTCVSWLNVK